MQAKLRAKKRKEATLEAERLRAEQEKKDAEEELKNAREEAESAERKQVMWALFSSRHFSVGGGERGKSCLIAAFE